MFEPESEIWRDVIEYEGYYKVSNLSRIKRVKSTSWAHAGKILKPQFGDKGYLLVRLYKEGKGKTLKLHNIVAEAFLGPRPYLYQVNHIDTNKNNNCANNLEYVENLYNNNHAYHNDLHRSHMKLTLDDIEQIRRLAFIGILNQREIAEKFEISQQHVSDIIHGKRWHQNWGENAYILATNN